MDLLIVDSGDNVLSPKIDEKVLLSELRAKLRNEEAKLLLMKRIKHLNHYQIPGLIPGSSNAESTENNRSDLIQKYSLKSCYNDIPNKKQLESNNVSSSKNKESLKMDHQFKQYCDEVSMKKISLETSPNLKVMDNSLEKTCKKQKFNDLMKKDLKTVINMVDSYNSSSPLNEQEKKIMGSSFLKSLDKDILKDLLLFKKSNLNQNWPIIPSINQPDAAISIGMLTAKSYLSNDSENADIFTDDLNINNAISSCGECFSLISPFWEQLSEKGFDLCSRCINRIKIKAFYKEFSSKQKSNYGSSRGIVKNTVQIDESNQIEFKKDKDTQDPRNSPNNHIGKQSLSSSGRFEVSPKAQQSNKNVSKQSFNNFSNSFQFITSGDNSIKLQNNTQQLYRPVILNMPNFTPINVDHNLTSFSKNINILHRPSPKFNKTILSKQSHHQGTINRPHILPNHNKTPLQKSISIRPIRQSFNLINYVPTEIANNAVKINDSNMVNRSSNLVHNVIPSHVDQVSSSRLKNHSKLVSATSNHQLSKAHFDNHNTIPKDADIHKSYTDHYHNSSYSLSNPVEFDQNIRFDNGYNYGRIHPSFDNYKNKSYYKI